MTTLYVSDSVTIDLESVVGVTKPQDYDAISYFNVCVSNHTFVIKGAYETLCIEHRQLIEAWRSIPSAVDLRNKQ